MRNNPTDASELSGIHMTTCKEPSDNRRMYDFEEKQCQEKRIGFNIIRRKACIRNVLLYAGSFTNTMKRSIELGIGKLGDYTNVSTTSGLNLKQSHPSPTDFG
ncbi:hypothetical protein M0804_006707 [Polistes exclamans]|nr:hypothetical protein M0804_006707 [Polistes exclamans]